MCVHAQHILHAYIFRAFRIHRGGFIPCMEEDSFCAYISCLSYRWRRIHSAYPGPAKDLLHLLVVCQRWEHVRHTLGTRQAHVSHTLGTPTSLYWQCVKCNVCVSNTLATHQQHISNTLATHQQRISNTLATHCIPMGRVCVCVCLCLISVCVSNTLATQQRHIAYQLEGSQTLTHVFSTPPLTNVFSLANCIPIGRVSNAMRQATAEDENQCVGLQGVLPTCIYRYTLSTR